MTPEETEHAVEHKLQWLQGTPQQRTTALNGLTAAPIPDPRLLARCEELLEDRTIALQGVPFTFGEVRWVAATAVAALRGVLNISVPVVILDAFPAVSGGKAIQLIREAGVEKASGPDGTIAALEVLAKIDRLPRRTITRWPGEPV